VSDPDRPRPVPGPPRPAAPGHPGGPVHSGGAVHSGGVEPATDAPATASPFHDLADRPVTEHVGVFEAEHDRLRRELSTIDQL
jgi:hypothetical protein